MKIERGRPILRYRNEAIFRSAQRLLKTPPPKPAKKNRAPRWIIFSLGFAVGLALALGLVLRIRRTPLHVGRVTVDSIFDSPAKTVTPKLQPVATPPASTPLLVSPSPTPSASVQVLSEPSPLAAMAKAVALARATRVPAAVQPPPYSNGPTGLVVGAAAVITEVTLSGELRAPGIPPLKVELSLRQAPNSQSVSGVIRFYKFDPSAFIKIAENALEGTFEGQRLSLHETSAVGSNSRGFPVGRQFELLIPNGTSSSAITGTWYIGGTAGTAILAFSFPK